MQHSHATHTTTILPLHLTFVRNVTTQTSSSMEEEARTYYMHASYTSQESAMQHPLTPCVLRTVVPYVKQNDAAVQASSSYLTSRAASLARRTRSQQTCMCAIRYTSPSHQIPANVTLQVAGIHVRSSTADTSCYIHTCGTDVHRSVPEDPYSEKRVLRR